MGRKTDWLESFMRKCTTPESDGRFDNIFDSQLLCPLTQKKCIMEKCAWSIHTEGNINGKSIHIVPCAVLLLGESALSQIEEVNATKEFNSHLRGRKS